jgi:radical SAM superfamily enzyme YgiQ (UPF0313 family)
MLAAMRVVLLRPPRYIWPFSGETSAFWPPLGLLCLAAALRRSVPGVQVEVLDAPGERRGWRQVRRSLAARPIDVLGLGEETVSADEALRAAALVRELWPDCTVVAGGVYFAHALATTLATGLVDVIVRGEGEVTFAELVQHLHEPVRWPQIQGLAFLDGDGRVVQTPPRPLIADLDSLPEPAFDLVPLQRYGRGSSNHPGLVSIEHSRGCVDSCGFCILWRQMGEPAGGNGELRPRVRTRSPARSFAEVERLYREHDRRTFGWVDPTFNHSPAWSDGWAERMLASDLVGPGGRPRTVHTAWVRADGIVRDEEHGILEKLVRAGLRQVMIGVERDDPAGLAALGKHDNDAETCRRAFAILRERYPEVYTIGTVIYGLPGDDLADLRRLSRCGAEWGMDYCFLLPLTPNPGTDVARQARAGGHVASEDLSRYNFHTPVCSTGPLSAREQESLYWRLMLSRHRGRPGHWLRRLLLERDGRRRRVHRALFWRGTEMALRCLGRAILHPDDPEPTLFSRKPPWYET